MTHRLRQKHDLNAVGRRPMIASLRGRCACAANEVLGIQVVIDFDCDEERFLWTMRQMWRDAQHEIEQHLKQGAKT